MSTQTTSNKLLKIAILGFAVMLLNGLLLLPLQPSWLTSTDDGLAYAQTGPADDTPTPIPTAQQPTIIIVPVPEGSDGGDGGDGGDGASGGGQTSDNDDDDDTDDDQEPTPTFTPLPSTTPTLTPPEIIIIEVTPNLTETVTIPLPEASPPTEPPVAETTPTAVAPATPELISDTPPAGVPALTGNGAIYRIPANPNRTPAMIMVDLTRGKLTLTVPTFPELDIVVRIDEDPALALNLPLSIPENVRPLALFNLDVYLVSGSTVVAKITTHSPELILVTQQPDTAAEEQVTLLRYDESSQQYERPRQEYEAGSQTFTAYLANTSLFILGIQSEQTNLVPAVPTLLPTVSPVEPLVPEPDASGEWLPLLWILLAFLVIFGGLIGLFLLLGGGRALANMLGRQSPNEVVDGHYTGGLLLAFPKQTLEVRSPIQIDLASLPTDPPSWTGSPAQATSAQIMLPVVNVGGYISTLKPNMPRLRQALIIPTGVKLISWDDISFRLSKLSYAIAAGYVDWPDSEESFSRLHDLQPGDEIEIRNNSGSVYQYRVEEVQSYQADLNASIDIPQTALGPQILLTAWSENYDLDEQEFRDYIVVRASVGQADISADIDKAEVRSALA